MKLASVHIYFEEALIIAQKAAAPFRIDSAQANLVINLVAKERSGHPEAIWSPIRSPGHLVVDLVVVDAFSLNIMKEKHFNFRNELHHQTLFRN